MFGQAGGDDVALAINHISSQTWNSLEKTRTEPSGKTTITPFSEVLKKEEQAASSERDKQVSDTQTTTLEDIFRRASEKYDVPYEFLVAVAKAESDFNPDCVSSAGAKGIMQLMPETARELGVKDVFDVEQNIMGAAKLLAAHLDKFDGDTTLAAAAYNAGSGRVQQYGGVPPFTETQNYVKKIAAYMKQGVDVPDKTVAANSNTLSENSTKQVDHALSGATGATEAELNNSRIVVGSGDSAITMTYGAYRRYLELGDLGVG